MSTAMFVDVVNMIGGSAPSSAAATATWSECACAARARSKCAWRRMTPSTPTASTTNAPEMNCELRGMPRRPHAPSAALSARPTELTARRAIARRPRQIVARRAATSGTAQNHSGASRVTDASGAASYAMHETPWTRTCDHGREASTDSNASWKAKPLACGVQHSVAPSASARTDEARSSAVALGSGASDAAPRALSPKTSEIDPHAAHASQYRSSTASASARSPACEEAPAPRLATRVRLAACAVSRGGSARQNGPARTRSRSSENMSSASDAVGLQKAPGAVRLTSASWMAAASLRNSTEMTGAAEAGSRTTTFGYGSGASGKSRRLSAIIASGACGDAASENR